VIPPALFAVAHGARIYRSRGILIFATLCLGVGTLLRERESANRLSIWLLQVHRPDGAEGLRSADSSRSSVYGDGLSVVGSRCRNPGLPERTALGEEDRFVAAGGKLRHDGLGPSMDAVRADIDHAWVWRDGGSYYGVPTSNFFGWFLTVYIFYQLFALYLGNRVLSDRGQVTGVSRSCFMPHPQRGISWLWLPCLYPESSWMPRAGGSMRWR